MSHLIRRVSFPSKSLRFSMCNECIGTCSSSSPTVNKRELNAWWGHRSVPDVRPDSSRAIVNWELSVASRFRFGAWASHFRIVIGCGRPIATNSNGKTSITLRTNLSDRRPKSVRFSWEAAGLKNPDNTSEGELPKSWMIRNGIRVLAKGSGWTISVL